MATGQIPSLIWHTQTPLHPVITAVLLVLVTCYKKLFKEGHLTPSCMGKYKYSITILPDLSTRFLRIFSMDWSTNSIAEWILSKYSISNGLIDIRISCRGRVSLFLVNNRNSPQIYCWIGQSMTFFAYCIGGMILIVVDDWLCFCLCFVLRNPMSYSERIMVVYNVLQYAYCSSHLHLTMHNVRIFCSLCAKYTYNCRVQDNGPISLCFIFMLQKVFWLVVWTFNRILICYLFGLEKFWPYNQSLLQWYEWVV